MAGVGDGVRGALKGCAADVEVAAGGVCEDVGEPCRGVGVEAEEMGVALLSTDELDRNRRVGALGMRAARRQVRQIIVDVCVLLVRLALLVVAMPKFRGEPVRILRCPTWPR
jgi:hypothetical protein